MGSDTSPAPSRSRYHDRDDREPGKSSRRSHRDSDRRRDRDDRRDDSRDGRSRHHRRSRSPKSPDARTRSRSPRDRSKHRHGDHRRRRSREGNHRERDERGSRRPRDAKPEPSGDEERGGNSKQVVRRSGPLPSQADSFAGTTGEEPPKEKEKPNFGTTGTLAAASNSVAQADGTKIVLKYHEPAEARKPSPRDQWKLFVFKGPDIIDTIELNHRTCWLVGRELAVVDVIAEHPSISKQHAVVQFRYLERRNEFGDKIGKVKPYLIDLESANGTMLNSKKVPESRYLELKDKDLIQFGQSTREYVIMLAPKQ